MPPEHDPEASPATETDATATSSIATDATPATVAADAKEPKPALLDVIKDVVAPEEDAEVSSTADAEKTDPAKVEGETAKADPPEDFKDLPFHKHPRFKSVLEERNSAQARVSELEAAAEGLKGPAEQYASIERFMQANGLGQKEVVDLFKIGALAKSDPEKALEALSPILGDLYARTGRILPEDLRTDVEEGKITEDRARELARERSARAETQRRADAAEERVSTTEKSAAETERRTAIEAALETWEQAKRKVDPDFEAKQELIGDRCRALMADQGQPRTAAEARSIVEQAHKDVTERLRKVIPSRPGMKRPPVSPSSTNATATPRNLKEAIALAATE